MADSLLVDRLGQPLLPVTFERNGNGYGVWYSPSASLYPISQTTPYRKWRPELLNDIARHLPAQHYRAMLSDSRHIYASGGGMVAGAVHKKADYTAGAAWTPQYTGTNNAWRKIAEPIVWLACRSVELRGLPYTWNRCAWLTSVCLDRDGDNFIVLTNEPETGRPKLQFLEAHRIGTPGYNVTSDRVKDGEYRGRKILNGVIYDDYMRPIGYNLLPETTTYATQDSFNVLPGASVIHVFDPKWFSQGRGIPSISYGILDWYDIAEIRDAEKIAVKVNSAHALIEKNETGTHDPTQNLIASRSAYWNPGVTKPQIEMLENGLIRYIKTNGSIESHKSDRPSQTWEGFMDHIARGGFLGMDWPIEVGWNMNTVGGAAVRAVVNQAQASVDTRQECMRDPFRNAFLYVLGSMIRSGELPFTDDWYDWTFTTPAKFSVDVGRDRQNVREDLAAGIVTLSKVVSDSGGDTETHLRQRAKDYKLAEEIAAEEGLPIEVIYNPLSAVQRRDPTTDNVSADPQEERPQPAAPQNDDEEDEP